MQRQTKHSQSMTNTWAGTDGLYAIEKDHLCCLQTVQRVSLQWGVVVLVIFLSRRKGLDWVPKGSFFFSFLWKMCTSCRECGKINYCNIIDGLWHGFSIYECNDCRNKYQQRCVECHIRHTCSYDEHGEKNCYIAQAGYDSDEEREDWSYSDCTVDKNGNQLCASAPMELTQEEYWAKVSDLRERSERTKVHNLFTLVQEYKSIKWFFLLIAIRFQPRNWTWFDPLQATRAVDELSGFIDHPF